MKYRIVERTGLVYIECLRSNLWTQKWVSATRTGNPDLKNMEDGPYYHTVEEARGVIKTFRPVYHNVEIEEPITDEIKLPSMGKILSDFLQRENYPLMALEVVFICNIIALFISLSYSNYTCAFVCLIAVTVLGVMGIRYLSYANKTFKRLQDGTKV